VTVTVGALCAGYGGLELGLELAGVPVELAWYAEIDRAASAVMARNYPDVPNLGDLTALEDPPPVDLVTAGFPCQPVSVAGNRRGVNDERWLIDDVCRITRRASARGLLLENVPGLLTANGGDAMARVVSGLAGLGFVAEWTCVRAADVGAPHLRRRWFGWAWAADADGAGGPARGDAGHGGERARVQPVGPPPPVADADGNGHGGGPFPRGLGRLDGEDAVGTQERERARPQPVDRGPAPAHADGAGRGEHGRAVAVRPEHAAPQHASGDPGRFGTYAPAVERWERVTGRTAPDPTVETDDGGRRLAPRFVEWMMGLPDGWVTAGELSPAQALRVLGNGVVPQQAAHALEVLAGQAADGVPA
jgi:DNA (cytosine-5)-methyltransferase 1